MYEARTASPGGWSKTMSEEAEKLSFEDALAELEKIVAQLESGDLTLEASLDLFEKGQKLAQQCNVQLETAALRIEQLTSDGEIVELDL
jgi:exodeoxyribonuclease VII small subunit